MSQVILSVPVSPEVKARMSSYNEIKWVEVARTAIVQKLELLEKFDKMLSKSEFSELDALKHGKIINQKILSRHLAKKNETSS